MRPFWLVCFLISGLAVAQTLSQQAAALLVPTKGAAVENVADFNFGALTLHADKPVHHLLVDGKPNGLIFENTRFGFNVSDPTGAAIAERNIKSFSPNASLAATMTRGVLWCDDLLVPAPGSSEMGESITWLKQFLADARFELPMNLILQSRLSGTPGAIYGIFVVESSTLTRYYIYKRDPLENRSEELGVLERNSGNGYVAEWRNALFYSRLATQPIDRQWWQTFTGPVIATHEAIDINNPEGDMLHITTTTDLLVTKDDTKIWRVDLLSHRISNRNALRPNLVTSLKVNGKPADYLHYNHSLLVALDRPYKAGERLSIETKTSGEVGIHEDGLQYWKLGTWAWYPQPPLNGEMATLDITVRCPKGQTPFASGDRVSLEDQGEYTVLKTHLDHPVQFPVAAAGIWYSFTEEREGVRCTVASYGVSRPDGSKRLANNFFAAIKYYGQLFGTPYPFKDMSIIEVGEWGRGQAPSNVIFISQEAFDTKGALINQLFSVGVNELIFHEVAHTWWGMIVKMDSIEEQWLTESFAEYSSALCMQAGLGGKKGAARFDKILKHWQGNVKLMAGVGSIYQANFFSHHRDIDYSDRNSLLYNRGPLVLHVLRLELGKKFGEEQGDKYFFTLLRSMVTNFKFKWGATRHMIGMLNQITQQDWQWFFDDYVYGTKVPSL